MERRRMRRATPIPVIAAAIALAACQSPSTTRQLPRLRLGYFPNITHSQAIIGVADGTFRRVLAGKAELEVRVFNAGPSTIEALFAGQLDLAYVGPNPAINGFIRSKGRALRIVAGATSGGAVLVVRGDGTITEPAQFAGKKIASPQLGNTQDVALRSWLAKQRLVLTERGGTTQVLPVANPDILTLFLRKEIDGAWVPEPWGARLVHEAGGRVFLDERSLWPEGRFVTAVVVVATPFLEQHPELVSAWLRAHVELTGRINADPAASRLQVNAEINRLTGQWLPLAELEDAWSRLTPTYDPMRDSLLGAADAAYRLGFLEDTPPDLSRIYNLTPLNQVLRARGLSPVE
jgi:NitT/TauT family transport system substrate-binding protein